MRLIDADALIKALNEAQVEFDEYYKGLGKAKVITDNAPSVNLEKRSFIEGYKEGCEYGKKCYERPQGEWITVKQDTILGKFEVNNKVCDQCNHATKYEYPFCPWCGAKMKGGAE